MATVFIFDLFLINKLFKTDSEQSFFLFLIYENILHAVSSWTNLMFGVDTASGSLLYSRELPTLQPFAITVYDNESPVTFNSKTFT